MTIKYVVLEIIDQFKATNQGQTMEIVLGSQIRSNSYCSCKELRFRPISRFSYSMDHHAFTKMLVTKLFCNQHFCKRSNNQLSYIVFKTCFEISAVMPFGKYLGQSTLLFLRKNHFFGHTALLSWGIEYRIYSSGKNYHTWLFNTCRLKQHKIKGASLDVWIAAPKGTY